MLRCRSRRKNKEIKAILDEAYEQAMGTLRAERQTLDRLAETLLQEEEVAGERALELVGVEDEEPIQSGR